MRGYSGSERRRSDTICRVLTSKRRLGQAARSAPLLSPPTTGRARGGVWTQPTLRYYQSSDPKGRRNYMAVLGLGGLPIVVHLPDPTVIVRRCRCWSALRGFCPAKWRHHKNL